MATAASLVTARLSLDHIPVWGHSAQPERWQVRVNERWASSAFSVSSSSSSPDFFLWEEKARRTSKQITCSSSQQEAVATSAGSNTETLKREIIRAVGGTNRGKNTTFEKRTQILDLIEELEKQNPTSNPAESPLLSGRWALLYTAPTDEETVDKFAGTEEGPFLARVKPLAFGGVRQKASIQVIDAENGKVENIAVFTAFNLDGELNIKGSCKRAEPFPTRGAVRVDVTFDSFVLMLGKLDLTIPLGWVNPKGWVDTTYLDPDFRVGRGDKGSVFVTSRIKEG